MENLNGGATPVEEPVNDQPIELQGGGAPSVEVETPIEGQPPVETPPVVEEPPYVLEMRKQLDDLKTWREEKEKVFAREKEETESPREPQPISEEEWEKKIIPSWGITQGANEDGSKYININPKQLITRIGEALSKVRSDMKSEYESMLHENVSVYRQNETLTDLEREHKDIKQFAPQIKEYLKKRYHPRDHSNKDFNLDGYWWAKGQASKEIQKNADANRDKITKVVQPAGGGAGARQTVKPGQPVSASREVADFLNGFKLKK